MADMRISLDMLNDRVKLIAEQRKNLVNPSATLKTTRAKQREEDPSLNPLDANILTVGQVLMGSLSQVAPETFVKSYMDVTAAGVGEIISADDVDSPFDDPESARIDGSTGSGAGIDTSGMTLPGSAGGSELVSTGVGRDAAARGWGPAPAPRDKMVSVSAGAAGVNFPGGVHEGIAPLVVALVAQIEEATGEKAKDGWCWGYAARQIRGGSSWSNHAWGLAIDFNAPDHPLGAEGTWGQYSDTVSAISNNFGFRWGGDYSGRKDDMHFEFMGTPEDAARLISQLNSGTAPTIPQERL